VSEELVRGILTEARWAPSATNTQSTYLYVLTGEALKTYKDALRQYSIDEVPEAPDLPNTRDLPPHLQARQQELFRTRMAFIAAEEAKAGVQPQTPPVSPLVAMAEIFGAPVVMVLAMDKMIGMPYGCFDAGLFAQSIALAAHVRGLGTCIAGSVVRYADLVRKVVPGLEDKNVIIAIALGYPDWDAPVNRFPRTRIPVDEFATFVK
jgi:nitroreductase